MNTEHSTMHMDGAQAAMSVGKYSVLKFKSNKDNYDEMEYLLETVKMQKILNTNWKITISNNSNFMKQMILRSCLLGTNSKIYLDKMTQLETEPVTNGALAVLMENRKYLSANDFLTPETINHMFVKVAEYVFTKVRNKYKSNGCFR